MNNLQKEKITRRDFAKLGGLAGLAVIGGEIIGPKKPALKLSTSKKQTKQDGWYPGICKMCMQGDCVTRVHVVNGVVVEVQGDKRAPNNQGTLCPRGMSSVMNIYNPWRVKAPMKRTNPEKGINVDPGWVEISWDEAMKTISDRLKKIHQEDPRKLITFVGFGDIMALRQLATFSATFGTPNCLHTHGAACAYHFGCNYTQGGSPEAVVDFAKAKYVVNFGRQFGPNRAVASAATRTFMDAIDNGVRVINIDPHCNVECSKSEEWIPIKPGTDCAFTLAMLHSILYEVGYYDEWFVKTRTNGPYLIGPDGHYMRDKASNKPLMWDAVEGKAKTFDEIDSMTAALEGTFEVDGVSATPGFQLIKDAMKKYTPEWAEGITTVSADTIRRVSREFMENAQIGATIDIDGVIFPYRPVGINYQRGAYQHTVVGVFGDVVTKIICELAGCMEVPGGISTNPFPKASMLAPDEDGVVKPRGECVLQPWEWPPNGLQHTGFYPIAHTLAHIGCNSILYPEEHHINYEPEMILAIGSNPMHSAFDRKSWEKVFQKVPFVASVTLTFDDTAVMADILLPEHSFFERDCYEPSLCETNQPHLIHDPVTRSLRVFPRRDASAIAHPYNTRELEDILYPLAEDLGILRGENGLLAKISKGTSFGDMKLDVNHNYTKYELATALLQNGYSRPDMKLEDINDESGPYFFYPFKGDGPESYNYFYWPDNKTRHPMYMIILQEAKEELERRFKEAGIDTVPGWGDKMWIYWKAWQPIPEWIENVEYTAPPEYDLIAMNWKNHFPFKAGEALANPWLHEVIGGLDPYEYAVQLNAKTAAEKGLVDGDLVVVESRYGKTQGRLKTTELIHPAAVGISGTHGAMSLQENPIVGEGPDFNALCTQTESYGSTDPITGGVDSGPAVKVYRA